MRWSREAAWCTSSCHPLVANPRKYSAVHPGTQSKCHHGIFRVPCPRLMSLLPGQAGKSNLVTLETSLGVKSKVEIKPFLHLKSLEIWIWSEDGISASPACWRPADAHGCLDRCLISTNLAILCSEIGTVYLSSEIVLAIKLCPH